MRHGRVQWSTLIPLGERELTETTARALDLHGRQADALMRAYRAHELRDEVELQLAHAFWAQLRAWMDTVAERITASAGEGAIPHRIYVLDATRNIPEAALSLETPYWERCLSFERCPEIISHSASSVRDVLDCTGQANGPAYLPLRSLARYVARIYAPGHNWDRALAEALQSRHA